MKSTLFLSAIAALFLVIHSLCELQVYSLMIHRLPPPMPKEPWSTLPLSRRDARLGPSFPELSKIPTKDNASQSVCLLTLYSIAIDEPELIKRVYLIFHRHPLRKRIFSRVEHLPQLFFPIERWQSPVLLQWQLWSCGNCLCGHRMCLSIDCD